MKIQIKDFDRFFHAREKLEKAVERLIINKQLVEKDEAFTFDVSFNPFECLMHIYLYRGIPGSDIDGYEYTYSMNELLGIEI